MLSQNKDVLHSFEQQLILFKGFCLLLAHLNLLYGVEKKATKAPQIFLDLCML